MAATLRILTRAGRFISDSVLALGVLWAVGLLVFQPVCIIPAVVLAAVAVWIAYRRKERLLRTWLWVFFLLSLLMYQLLPNPQGPWQQPWRHLPECSLDGDILTVRSLRNFSYTTEDDFQPRYETRTYDLSTLVGADYAECRWDGHREICHTMVSFAFADGRHLVFSAETRLPQGAAQNALGGIYKCYGLAHLIGTEEDIFALRTNYRHEDLSLYPLNITPEETMRMFINLLAIAETNNKTGRVYNTVTANCSTIYVNLMRHRIQDLPKHGLLLPVFNARILEVLYKNNCLKTRPGESLSQLRARAQAGYDIPLKNYSRNLRARLE